MGLGRWMAGALGAAVMAAGAAAASFTNPILPYGPDPWIARSGKTYYLMVTQGNRLTIRKTTDITKAAAAPEITVWKAPLTGPNTRDIWAPELHQIGGKWFIYYAACCNGPGDTSQHRGIYVLENDGPDPTQGRWIDRGRVNTARPGIDATVFDYRGKYYLAYSAALPGQTVIAIGQLSNPWTLTGRQSIISRPDQGWERAGYPINEAPEFLLGPKGDLFLTYSGAACTIDDYAVGMLTARPGSDPLDPRAWTKSPDPVVAKNPAVSVFATGHNGFFTAPDGKHWIVFHANPGPSQGCDGKRGTWIEPVIFGYDGKPIFLPPTGPNEKLPAPGGQAAGRR